MNPPASFEIEGRPVGPGAPCFLVAEVAQAHDGSLGIAHAYVDAVARAGAHAIKFQTHIASAESTPQEPWRVKFSPQDDSRYEYWKRMEFSLEDWKGLRRHADEAGLVFLSSPFSCEAVELLDEVGCGAWKIASGETNNGLLLDACLERPRPFLVSTGMSPHAEIEATVKRLKAADAPFALLQCTSIYPCPPEKVGINVMEDLGRRHGCPVGLSDHSGSPVPPMMAAARGAAVLEVHVVMSREMYGPDVPVSLLPDELKTLADGIAMMHRIESHPVDKDGMADELAEMRRIFNKSLYPAGALPRGTRLERSHLTAKKPGTSIPVDALETVVGRTLVRDVSPETALEWADFEPVS